MRVQLYVCEEAFWGHSPGPEMAWITDQEQQVSTWDSVFWNFRGRNNSGWGGEVSQNWPSHWVGQTLAEAPSVGLNLTLCGMNRNVSKANLRTQSTSATDEETWEREHNHLQHHKDWLRGDSSTDAQFRPSWAEQTARWQSSSPLIHRSRGERDRAVGNSGALWPPGHIINKGQMETLRPGTAYKGYMIFVTFWSGIYKWNLIMKTTTTTPQAPNKRHSIKEIDQRVKTLNAICSPPKTPD